MILFDQRLMRLAYVSVAAPSLTREDLIALGREGRRDAEALKLTGLLLHVDDEFFQVLEGPQPAVEQMLAQISGDARNSWVTPLLREHPFRRVFKTWSMGCFGLPFDELPAEVFFRADWEAVRSRAGADERQEFFRFLERFYHVNSEAGRGGVV